MSRRTRISRDIRHRRLGTNHHSIYSSSSTSFPSSYSIFGTPISMPAKILPLISNNKINYVSKPEQLLYNQCPLITLEYQHIRNAKQMNLTIAGKLIQKQNKIITRIVFFFSMILCCLLSVFGCSWFRKKCYARYKTSLEQYRKLSGILNQLESCEKLILNIQDNDLNDQKIQLIERAIMTSKVEQNRLESDRQITQTQRKKVVTIRNFCYFMNQMDINKSFKHLMGNENIEFIFVWQKQVISSSKDKGKNSESESMLGSKFGF